jgi:hypothetical protein
MVRLTSLSHIVAFLPLLINQFVSGESYYTRLLHDGSNIICRVHNIIHNNRKSSTIQKFKYDDDNETEVGFPSSTTTRRRRNVAPTNSCSNSALVMSLLRGGASFNPFPSGYHPFGYGITDLGRSFLEFDGSIDSDIGKFLSTFKGGAGDGGGGGKRKSTATMKDQWLEIVRVAKTGQSMRIYRRLDEIIDFCVKAGLLD